MKIISNFHDYYDAVGAYDHDAEPIYVRHAQEIILNKFSNAVAQENVDKSRHLNELFFPQQVTTRDKYNFHRNPSPLPVPYHLVNDNDASAYQERGNSGYISFCGKVYPFYIMDGPDGEIYCYNIEQYINAIRLINPINKKKILESIESGEYQMKDFSGKKFTKKDFISRSTWSKFIAEYNNKINVEHYRYFKCPVALRRYQWHGDPPQHNKLVILNPRLNQYNFQSQVDPFTAYQELSMYLGNQLVDTNNMTPQPITDVMRAETKGFNEWSFRRHKTEDTKYKKKHKE